MFISLFLIHRSLAISIGEVENSGIFYPWGNTLLYLCLDTICLFQNRILFETRVRKYREYECTSTKISTKRQSNVVSFVNFFPWRAMTCSQCIMLCGPQREVYVSSSFCSFVDYKPQSCASSMLGHFTTFNLQLTFLHLTKKKLEEYLLC